MTLRFYLSAFLAALAVMFSGCAATINTYTPVDRIAVSSTASKKVVLRVVGTPTLQVSSTWTSFAEEWRWSMHSATDRAKIAYVFATRDSEIPAAGKATLIKVSVNDYRYMSQVQRYMFGILTGNAYMDVDVEYIELPANKVVATKKFNTTTSAWHGVFSAATPKQVAAVVDTILADIRLGVPN